MESLEARRARIIKILNLLKSATADMQQPMSVVLGQIYGRDPFITLISCLLSLRARDVMTLEISKELFSRIRTPQELIRVPVEELEELFYPLGFYRKKARLMGDVAEDLLARFNGKVPGTLEELLSIKGVGRKTANLVLGEGFGIPSICVDTHVHRLSNRLGWVKTTNPEQTEMELRKLVPEDYWISLNHLLVMWGQNICTPLSPWCSRCVLNPLCPKVGVVKNR